MQQQFPVASCSKSTDDAVDPAIKDCNLFYTASVHFLKKRLEEKAQTEQGTQSCCDFTSHLKESLSFDQILPYPKPRKGIFSRVMGVFRKYKRDVSKANFNSTCECTGHSSLVPIEEESDESVKTGARSHNDITGYIKRVNR
ncbi:unnamed protein product [Pieris macdunnoughi]|uniref:Uncharacterized protein n=1 Tax=Pieris macdunnoughi TaxID=345717 RepID=A0A821NCM2_9NEOP|nr:unnamed protein product [Pieris macdunnoughi]